MLHALSGFALLASAAAAAVGVVGAGGAGGAAHHARLLSEIPMAVTPPLPPPPPPPHQAGLLCPPNTLHLNLNNDQMLAARAVKHKGGECWDMSGVAVMNGDTPGLFNRQLPTAPVGFELPSDTIIDYMFYHSPFDQQVVLTGLGTVQTTASMFDGASAFNSRLSLGGLGSTGNWKNADGMFQRTTSFNQPIDAIGDTQAVSTFERMFYLAESFNRPVTALPTTSATTMNSMFMLASAFNQPVDHFVTGNVKTFFSMFDSAGRFNQAVGGWDVSSANDMSG